MQLCEGWHLLSEEYTFYLENKIVFMILKNLKAKFNMLKREMDSDRHPFT